MMIYEPEPADGYEWVVCRDDADYDVFQSFDGSPRASNWKPVLVDLVRADEGEVLKESAFPWLGSETIVMRRNAVDALRDLLESNGEILPLAAEDRTELFALNVTRVLDALDEEHSEILRFSSSKRIMQIKSAAFFEPVVRGVDIFRLPQQTLRCGPIYVSDRFVNAVKDAGLCCLDFTPVWSPPE